MKALSKSPCRTGAKGERKITGVPGKKKILQIRLEELK